MSAMMHNFFEDDLDGEKVVYSDSPLLSIATDVPVGHDILNFHFGNVPVPSSFYNKDQYISILNEIQEGLKEKNEIIEEIKKETEEAIKSDAYYKIKNHDELYKLGESYTEDINEGQRIFAFTASENQDAVRNVVMGLAAHFEFHMDKKIHIIVDSGRCDYFNKIFDKSTFVDVATFKPGIEVDSEGIYLWEVPSGRQVLKSIKDYFPMLTKIDSCSIVVSKNNSQFKKINMLTQFYSKYKVKVKGLIFEEGVE